MLDKVVGYFVGGTTNLVPGTGFIRDWYSPDNSSDYNSALKHTDEAAAALGIGLVGREPAQSLPEVYSLLLVPD